MNPIVRVISAFFVYGIKLFSLIFYRTEAKWLTPESDIHWDQIRLAVILNHTSLFEPLFLSAISNIRLWRAIQRVVVPVADVTMNRPIAGRLFKFLVPNCIPITRKRDDSWERLLSKAKGDSIILIFPEGRMKRADGLDKHGNPMSVKGGVADILAKIDSGKILIAYSGGLHHVQTPGEAVPHVFKEIHITFEEVDIQDYKRTLAAEDHLTFRKKVIADLEGRKQKYC